MTAGLGSRRSAWSSSGRGGFGMAGVLSAGMARTVVGSPGLRLEAQQDRGPAARRGDDQAAVLPDAVVALELAQVALVGVHVVDAAPRGEAEIGILGLVGAPRLTECVDAGVAGQVPV